MPASFPHLHLCSIYLSPFKIFPILLSLLTEIIRTLQSPDQQYTPSLKDNAWLTVHMN